MTSIVTLIQARTGSSRFPAKILKPVLSQTMLYRMMERVRQSQWAGQIVIATTDLPEDRIIEKICEQNEWECFRGDELDLLTRHYQAAKKYKADIVLYNTEGIHWLPRYNDIASLVYAANSSDVDTVFIAGKCVMKHRELLTIDEEKLRSEIQKAETYFKA